MKMLLLATALTMGGAAVAQTAPNSPMPSTARTPPPGAMPMSGMQDMRTTPPADRAMQPAPARRGQAAPMTHSAPMGQDGQPMRSSQTMMPGSTGMSGGMSGGSMGGSNTASSTPMGGYSPANPPMSGPMQPGATVVFRQAPSVNEAFPPPAARESYPICRRGQTDGCRQRGD